MDRKIAFYDTSDDHADMLEVEAVTKEDRGDGAEPFLNLTTTRAGVNLNYAQVLKLRDVASEWLGRHLKDGPKLWDES